MNVIESDLFFRSDTGLGSPAILGDKEEDVDLDDGGSDFNYTSENQNEKQKIAERMLSWQMTYGRGEDVTAPNYDKEVSHNHIPLLTNGHEVGFTLLTVLKEFGMKDLIFLPFFVVVRFLENCLQLHPSGFLWHLLAKLGGSVSIPIRPMLINHV